MSFHSRSSMMFIAAVASLVCAVWLTVSHGNEANAQQKSIVKISATASAPSSQPAKDLTLDLGDNVSMKLVLIPAGNFTMGSPDDEKDRSADEGPQREVTISKPFYMGAYEVTQDQWKAVMGTEPWKDQPNAKAQKNNAASYVSWKDAVAFCEKLSQKTGKTVALPTEAQWEYACRAGSKTPMFYGDDADYGKIGDYAWYLKNAQDANEKYGHAVGLKKPNAWGLYDICGNLWEWCSDWYDKGSYASAENKDPAGPATGKNHVMRGGCWNSEPKLCRSAGRSWDDPGLQGDCIGFRVIVDAK